MTPEEEALCRELMQADLERSGPPEEFDARGCRAVLAMLAAFWIIALGALAWAFDFQPWAALCGVMTGGR